MLGLTSLKVWNSVLDISKTKTRVELHKKHSDSKAQIAKLVIKVHTNSWAIVSFESIKDGVENNFRVLGLRPEELKDVTKRPIIIEK